MKSRHDAFHRVWFKLQWPRWLHIPPSQRDDVLRGANPNIVNDDDAEAQNVEHNSGGAM